MMDGEAVMRGIDPLKLPIDRFCNWVWHMLARNRNEKQMNELRMEVYRPLPGQDPDDVTEGPWSDDEMGAAFMELQRQMGGG